MFTDKFLRYTGDEAKSAELALLFYLAIVGSYQALSRPKNPPQIKELLQGIIARYLIAQQAPVMGNTTCLMGTPRSSVSPHARPTHEEGKT